VQKVVFKVNNKIIGIKNEERKKVKKSTHLSQAVKNLDKSNSFSDEDAEFMEKRQLDRLRFLEEELQRSREESFKAGYEEGKQQSMRESRVQTEKFSKQIASLHEQYVEALKRMDIPILNFSKKMAEKIIDFEIEQTEDIAKILLKKIGKLLHELINQNEVIIEVNPELVQVLENQENLKNLSMSQNMKLTVIGDDSLKPGECLVKTKDYFIDETYLTQLDELADQILNEDREWKN